MTYRYDPIPAGSANARFTGYLLEHTPTQANCLRFQDPLGRWYNVAPTDKDNVLFWTDKNGVRHPGNYSTNQKTTQFKDYSEPAELASMVSITSNANGLHIERSKYSRKMATEELKSLQPTSQQYESFAPTDAYDDDTDTVYIASRNYTDHDKILATNLKQASFLWQDMSIGQLNKVRLEPNSIIGNLLEFMNLTGMDKIKIISIWCYLVYIGKENAHILQEISKRLNDCNELSGNLGTYLRSFEFLDIQKAKALIFDGALPKKGGDSIFINSICEMRQFICYCMLDDRRFYPIYSFAKKMDVLSPLAMPLNPSDTSIKNMLVFQELLLKMCLKNQYTLTAVSMYIDLQEQIERSGNVKPSKSYFVNMPCLADEKCQLNNIMGIDERFLQSFTKGKLGRFNPDPVTGRRRLKKVIYCDVCREGETGVCWGFNFKQPSQIYLQSKEYFFFNCTEHQKDECMSCAKTRLKEYKVKIAQLGRWTH